ncbi:SDR family oxidoreductase [Aquincola sp. S2]|uniref:SDR family oxidoreductase n=1 Tax=Pseudaquabacterium terrae TaxID=2732868 RepID=A0ABX2EC37_9BURK|nr:SDR family oxidoreductase [Aquabacterium terrae]NRF66714.1 SDR family oxidoreductase [Aquabacterium terrae]
MPKPTATSSRPVVLVTGGARRIGRAIVLALAESGWDIALHCRSSRADADATAAEAEAAGARAEVFQANLADSADCEALVPAVLLRCGRLDAVVNNASLFEYDDVASFTVSAMEHHWRANTAPAILLARALHEHLCERGTDNRGCVVNLLDQKLANPNPDYLSYTLSKAALEAATTMLAQALAPVLRVCGVSPGVTLLSGSMSADEFARSHRMTPLERSSTPEDVARAVRFILESPAITGTTLLVDGGQHLLPQPRDVMFLSQKNES